MARINIEELEPFMSLPVRVAIQGEQGEEEAPWMDKTIKKAELCPDGTHVRFYFDHFYFLAVPLTSTVTKTESRWTAYDQEAGLYYIIKKGERLT
ncbi:MAG TPA: hypothetical protein VNM45_12875 [Bacillus sp. (in: firmicutes)]|nr:hypothetical protein [Bacillus sp. (in: firmicutes)]